MSKKIALIVADDTTGANASGILLQKLGLKVVNDFSNSLKDDDYDVIAIETSSRAVSPNLAYSAIRNALNQYLIHDYLLINKRVDSTLRGNIGIELDAFFDYYKNDCKAIIVASFPDSKRIAKNGLLYVDNQLLATTQVAQDPKMPITSSNIKELFKKNSRLVYQNLEDDITQLSKNLENCDALIIDASTNEEIEEIAKNISELEKRIICVDPGPLSQKVAYYQLKKIKEQQQNLFVIGSVVKTTQEQLQYINKKNDFTIINVDVDKLLNTQSTTYLNSLLNKALTITTKNIVFSTINPSNIQILDLEKEADTKNCTIDDVSNIINSKLADLAILYLDNVSVNIKNIYLSGGDVAIAFLSQINAQGLNLVDEIIPLAVHSKIIGSKYHNLNLITKGGTIGTIDTLELISKYMEEI